jgi:AbrB family looped-hinge helix DNA binding protein
METFVSRISTKYQVVIPKAVREALCIRPQDNLLFLIDGDMVIIRPQPDSFTDVLAGLHQHLWSEPEEWLEGERSLWE